MQSHCSAGSCPLTWDWNRRVTTCTALVLAHIKQCCMCLCLQITFLIHASLSQDWKIFAVMRAGDWKCPDCTAHNFASKVVCYRCSY